MWILWLNKAFSSVALHFRKLCALYNIETRGEGRGGGAATSFQDIAQRTGYNEVVSYIVYNQLASLLVRYFAAHAK